MPKLQPAWPATSIKRSSYLRGRIGWQGLRASEFIDHGPFLITGTDFLDSGRIDWSRCYHVSEARFREGAYIQVRDGDILVTKDGTIGKVAYVRDCPEKAVLNSGVFLLRCSDGSYEHRFLYHLLRSDLFGTFLRLNLAGSTISHLYQYVFERFEFPTPEKATQQETSEILSTVDEAIEQTEALIAKTQQIKAGLMHDLFTRGVTQAGQLRPPRDEAPKLYKDSPLGWIPKEWDIRQLRSCLLDNPTNGIYKPAHLIGRGTLLIGQAAFTAERSIDFALSRRAVVTDEELRRYGVAADNILVSRVFATVEGVGQPTLVPPLPEPAVFESNMMRLRVDQNAIRPRLLFEWLRSRRARQRIEGGVNASNQASVNQGVLNTLPVLWQPPEEQDRLVRVVEEHDEKHAAEQATLAKLQSMKRGLMEDLLTGRVRVPVADAQKVAANV